jgi:hypothetical protein
MRVLSGAPCEIRFTWKLPAGKEPHERDEPKKLVVECVIPHWGIVESMQIQAYRDCQRVYNIHTATIGVREDGAIGQLKLKLQMIDSATESTEHHAYQVDVQIQFLHVSKLCE